MTKLNNNQNVFSTLFWAVYVLRESGCYFQPSKRSVGTARYLSLVYKRYPKTAQLKKKKKKKKMAHCYSSTLKNTLDLGGSKERYFP